MADTMQDNLQGDLTMMKSALEGVGIAAYDGFSAPMRNAVQSVTEALGSYDVAKLINGISYEIGQLASGIATRIPGALNTIVGFLQAIVDNIGPITKGIEAFIITWGVISGLRIAMSIGGVVAQIATLVSGLIAGTITIGGVTTALGGMSAALGMATGGISLIVGGLAFLATKLFDGKNKSDEFSDSFIRGAATLTEFEWGLKNLQPTLSGTKDLISSTGNTMSDLENKIRIAEQNITNIMYDEQGKQKTLRDTDIQQIKDYYAEIHRLKLEQLEIQRQQQEVELLQLQRKLEKEGVLNQEAAAQAIVDANAAYEQSAQATQEFYESEYARIVAYHQKAGTYGSEAMQKELDELDAKNAEEIAKNEAKRDQMLQIVADESSKWVMADKDKWSQLASNSNIGKNEYKAIMNELDSESSRAFMNMVAQAKSNGIELTGETRSIAQDMLKAFENMPDDMEESGKEALEGMISGVKDKFPSLKNTSEMTVDQMVNAIKKDLGLQGGGGSTVLKGVGRNTVLGIESGMESEQKGVENTASKAARGVLDTFNDEFEVNSPSRAMQRTGQYLVEGLSGGIQSKSGWLTTKLANFANGVKNKINNFFGVQSPSRVTAETGKFLAMGLGVGIEKNGDAAIKPMQGLVDKIKGVDVTGEWDKLSGVGGSLNYDVSAQLGDYVSSAIDSNSAYALLSSLIDAVEDLASRAINLDIDGMRFAEATAGASDSVSGTRLNLRNRGLAL